MEPNGFDWSLERQGQIDQARHRQRVIEAVREHLEDLISDESMIASDGKHIFKIPVRTLKEYKFRFDPHRETKVGQGEGARVGDVIARGAADPSQAGPGQAGDGQGSDVIEVEVSLEDVEPWLFADWELPGLKPRPAASMDTASYRFTDVAKRGSLANLDKRRTVLENIKRNARRGVAAYGDLHEDDLRFRYFQPETRHHTQAVVIAMRDVSGSMGEFKKYMARSFFFWMVRFLRTRYDDVALRFITHHIEAQEVDEKTFFHLGESGGTRVSSAYKLALDMVEAEYPASHWNVYLIHFSDGDNWGDADNRRCVELVQRLLERTNAFCYGEINEGSYKSPLMQTFEGLHDPRFVTVRVQGRQDLHAALRRFFSPAGGASA